MCLFVLKVLVFTINVLEDLLVNQYARPIVFYIEKFRCRSSIKFEGIIKEKYR